MPCVDLGGVVVCSPTTVIIRAVMHCPTCERRRRFSGRDAVWYGPTWTCCACGDSFADGWRMERPFQRGWRKRAIADAKADWERAVTKAEHRAWLFEQMGWT